MSATSDPPQRTLSTRGLRSRMLASAVAGGLVGIAAGTAVVTTLSGRSRPAIPGLERLDPPPGLPPARVVAVPGRGEMFFRDHPGPTEGSLPPVVLLHGWLASADLNWFTAYDAVGALARVIAPDHRGHGRGARHSQPYRMADVADDVAALIRQLDVGPVIVAGYSMGGPIAQLLWQRHPDLVAGAVLCATAAQFRFGLLNGAQWRFMSVYQVGSRLLPRTWLERILLAQLNGMLPIQITPSVSPEMSQMTPRIPWLVGEFERADVEDASEAGRELGKFDSRGWIGGFDRPAAVIVTTRDRLVPPTTQLELVELIDDALVIELSGDHDAPTAVGAEFGRAIAAGVTHVGGRATPANATQ